MITLFCILALIVLAYIFIAICYVGWYVMLFLGIDILVIYFIWWLIWGRKRG